MKTGTVPVTIGGGGRTATFHYLGAGGWMIRRGNDAVLLAPFFSNPGMIPLALGADSNPRIVTQHMQRVHDDLPYVRAIVAGHAHYDHIMDLPTVFALPHLNADAPLLGGPTVCNTLYSALGNRPCIRMTETPIFAAPGIEVRAYFSEHAAHVMKTKLFNGHYLSPLPRVPSHGFRWREGETLEDYLDHLQPRHSLLGHWESFFRRASLPSRTLPFTDVPEFLRRMGGWGYTLPERHAVVLVGY
jgi:ribonuclease BN (tRNA processing enzyme)